MAILAMQDFPACSPSATFISDMFNKADMLKEQAYVQVLLWKDRPTRISVMSDAATDMWKEKDRGVLRDVPKGG